MNIVCENCKAPYTGPVSSYSKFVKCPYCECAIQILNKSIMSDNQTVRTESVSTRDFSVYVFEAFLNKRGYKCFDPVSGIVRLRNQEVIVSPDGSVTGPDPLKSRVEKWLSDFMTET